MKLMKKFTTIIATALTLVLLSIGTARADDVRIGFAFLFPIPLPIPIYEIPHEPSPVTVGLLFPIPIPLPVYDYGYHRPVPVAVPVSYGRLETLVSPYFADVYVDGKHIGRTGDFSSRMTAAQLDPGVHTVEILAPRYKGYRTEIHVSPNGLVSIEYALQPLK